MTIASLLTAAAGVLFLLIAIQSPASADTPIRIRTTRTTPGTMQNPSTTRLRVTSSEVTTRISSIKEVTAGTNPLIVQTATLQGSANNAVTSGQTEETDSFPPIIEIKANQNSQQQSNTQSAVEDTDRFQPQISDPAPSVNSPPVFLLGQDTTEQKQPVEAEQAEPVKLNETQPAEATEDGPALPNVPIPQQGVLDPLAAPAGAAIKGVAPLNPRNCGTPDCEKAATLISAKPISEISLDISPSYKPNLDQKPPKLQQEVRKWRNRSGQVLAEGQLADYAYSNVHIKGSDGKLTALPINELSVDDICYIADAWGFPKQCRIDNSPYEQRAWESLNFHWRAAAAVHKPIYFEDAQLERHGHTLGPWLQPMRSGAHFFTNIAILPYHMGIHPWNECRYALGYHRPGSPAPRIRPAFPISKKAALIQAGSILGGVFIIP